MKITTKKGAVAPLVAILLVILIICVALVVDLGHVHNVKIQLQRAVDAAALAGAKELPDGNYADVAISVAAANRFGNDRTLEITAEQIEPGRWDSENLGETIYNGRFTPTTENPNALLVRANTVVEHVFGIVPGWASSVVSVDAIAVNEASSPSLPIAFVSCIPTGGEASEIIEESPGLTICDIATYKFNKDNEDTAAWTSLTYGPANNPNIDKFVKDRTLFDDVIFGNDEFGTEGLEHETPASIPSTFDNIHGGCEENFEKNIRCGLGSDFDSNTSPSSDPLVAYADGDSLPRWHQQQFIDLVTMNGRLLGDNAQLEALYDTIPAEFAAYDNGTSRLATFIEKEKQGQQTIYTPKLNRVVDYAGYPPVWVNNGTMTSVMKVFLDRVVLNPKNVKKSGSFMSNLTGVYPPFDDSDRSYGEGETVVLTIPVIFAGTCDEWKASSKLNQSLDSNPVSTPMHYVGLANFLMTRLFVNNKCFDVDENDGEGPVTVSSVPSEPSDCITGAHNTPLGGDTADTYSCDGFKAPPTAIEGLLRPPFDEDIITTVTRVYLVE